MEPEGLRFESSCLLEHSVWSLQVTLTDVSMRHNINIKMELMIAALKTSPLELIHLKCYSSVGPRLSPPVALRCVETLHEPRLRHRDEGTEAA